MGLDVLGTLGVLVLAKRAKLIESVAPLIAQARTAGFRVSDAIVQEILRRAAE